MSLSVFQKYTSLLTCRSSPRMCAWLKVVCTSSRLHREADDGFLGASGHGGSRAGRAGCGGVGPEQTSATAGYRACTSASRWQRLWRWGGCILLDRVQQRSVEVLRPDVVNETVEADELVPHDRELSSTRRTWFGESVMTLPSLTLATATAPGAPALLPRKTTHRTNCRSSSVLQCVKQSLHTVCFFCVESIGILRTLLWPGNL